MLRWVSEESDRSPGDVARPEGVRVVDVGAAETRVRGEKGGCCSGRRGIFASEGPDLMAWKREHPWGSLASQAHDQRRG